jgi:hypothetical protein
MTALITTTIINTELRELINSTRGRVSAAVNAELSQLYWRFGARINAEVLGGARANYGAAVVDQLGMQLSAEFGRGFEAKNLRRMMKFAELDTFLTSFADQRPNCPRILRANGRRATLERSRATRAN